MKIFISWSKPLSKRIAESLSKWIKDIFPRVTIFMSSEDIQTGARWNMEISKKLEETNFGIIILTHENFNAPWVHFEAGALSKIISDSRVCPLLVDVNNRDILGPLSQFQCSSIQKEDILQLLKSINQANDLEYQNEDDWIERTFKRNWQELDTDIHEILNNNNHNRPEITELSTTDRLLDEVLQHVRSMSQLVQIQSNTNATEKTEPKEGCVLMVRSVLNESHNLINDYREEIPILKSFKQAGITSLYKNRKLGIKAFHELVDKSKEEVYIIGSSLKGLLQDKDYKEFAKLIQIKSKQKGLQLRFLLTHPCVADFRAKQEKRKRNEIGQEVIDSLKILQSWDIKENCVKLYMGTPTCFGIKADNMMFLNPYPYGDVSYNSPCFIVERKDDASGFFYDAFDNSHFGVWESQVTESIESFDITINRLQEDLPRYSDLIDNLLQRLTK